VSDGFHILKVNGLTHVHMLIIKDMWKESLVIFYINVRFLIVTYVLINYSKCKMQLLKNSFNMLKVDCSIHVQC